MHLPDLSRNPALWLGLRQAESLREALCASLDGRPLGHISVKEWLASQHICLDENVPDNQLIWSALTRGFESGFGTHPEMLVRGSNAPVAAWINSGEKRSGAGWRDPANFLITSAFIRVLGALEQYELDVLKVLFYYRPLGLLGDGGDQLTVFAETDVIEEIPVTVKNKQIFCKPSIWTWLRRQAENNIERAKIFKTVFGIITTPEEFTSKREGWYEKRNCVAHGRAGVDMTLAEYIEVDVYVAKAMIYVSQQCKEQLKVVV